MEVDHHQPRRSSDLQGKVVMVTGASSGIGYEFCLVLANSGCRIIAAARRTDRLRSLCHQINALPLSFLSLSSSSPLDVRAIAIELDVTADGTTIDASVQKAWEGFGRIDALINNAGVRGNVRSSLDVSEEEWNNTVKSNLTGLWLVSKSVCRRMRDAKVRGSIVNISSIGGLNGGHLPGSAAYSVSKAAVNILTKMMALELGEYKIRVNSIAPGIFKSEITEKLVEKDWFNKVTAKIVPLGMHGTTDPALTSLVRYLINDYSEYVTGNIFIVDAGVTLPGVPIFSSL